MAALIRRSPRALTLFEPTLFEDIDELASRVWDSWRPVSFTESLVPRMEMYEDKDNLVVKAELPGINKKDIDITLDKDMLTVKAERKDEKTEKSEDTNYYYCERSYGQFSRTVSLPFPVDSEKISAHMKGGVLEITLPKSAEVRSRKIEVKAS